MQKNLNQEAKRAVWKCPRCGKFVRNHPAISRRDNQTEICSVCGMEEAIFDFWSNYYKEHGEGLKEEMIQKERAWLELVTK